MGLYWAAIRTEKMQWTLADWRQESAQSKFTLLKELRMKFRGKILSSLLHESFIELELPVATG